MKLPKLWYNYIVYVIDNIPYTTSGYFGCQIKSIESKKPKLSILNSRQILGVHFRPVDAKRVGLWKWEICWCISTCPTAVQIEDFLNTIKNKINEQASLYFQDE